MPRKSLRQASREASKQMQLLSNSVYSENDDTMDKSENFDVQSEDEEKKDVEEAPPKKKMRLQNRKSDTQVPDFEEPVVAPKKNEQNVELLTIDAWIEDLSEAQKAARLKLELEYKELTAKIEQLTKSAEVIFQGEVHSAFEIENNVPSLVNSTPDVKKKTSLVNTKSTPTGLLSPNKSNSTKSSYQLVVDPRGLGVIVGTVTPTSTPPTTPASNTAATSQSSVTSRTLRRIRPSIQTPPLLQSRTSSPKTAKSPLAPSKRSGEIPSAFKGANVKANTGKPSNSVVDLTSEENASTRSTADTKEVSFNKIQGKTFPSLVVVARPHLSVKDITGGDRTKLDAKVKSVLTYVPTKFTEWLIQQGLIRSEQVCSNHSSSKLKLGMYSDVSKLPYSGGYVWISECCPSRFVSVFNGSLFEGSSYPPTVILKLIYHWACQTNVQNILQWVKIDNMYLKGINTILRGVCTAALHTHIDPLGGPGKRIEVGVISLGTTTQDGLQRQVKVEVLGVLESENKHVRLRAIEPLLEADRNYKKRFAKILEPLNEWVKKDSIIVTDLTVDKQTLLTMGFINIQQSTSTDQRTGNQTIMEYLRRIVPRMFQNTLSLLSRQIIQQFLDELVWREWYGTTAAQCFDNMLLHISEQTRAELAMGESLIVRLNKVAANPFRDWGYKTTQKLTNKKSSNPPTDQVRSTTPAKKVLNRSTKKIINTSNIADNSSPELMLRAISPDVPEELVSLENYYYGTIETNVNAAPKVTYSMKCSMCKSVFTNNLKLLNHLFTHAHNVTGNIFQCHYCLSRVGSQEGLIKHISLSHPLETKFDECFVCMICEQKFPNTFSLGKHLSKEHVPSELPYNCGTCSYRCSSHRQAIEHFYNKHDSGTTIQCPFCLKSTTIVSSGRILSQNLNFFLQHLQKHQKKALARKCGKCALWFVNKDTLKEHQTVMHVSQRRKPGLVPWPVPRNGIMVPKSKSDKQLWEDNEREVDISNITINSLPNKLVCKECKQVLKSTGHFKSLGGCPNQNCQYETYCTKAMEIHTLICKDLNSSLPVRTLSKPMFCVCGYSETDGNKLAKHLAKCERKSAYPSVESSKMAIKKHSMLDVLGLVRRPEEPLKSSVVDLIELDDEREEHVEMEQESNISKTTKRKRRIEEETVAEVAEKRTKSMTRNNMKVVDTRTLQYRKVELTTPPDALINSADESMQVDNTSSAREPKPVVAQKNAIEDSETIVLDDDDDMEADPISSESLKDNTPTNITKKLINQERNLETDTIKNKNQLHAYDKSNITLNKDQEIDLQNDPIALQLEELERGFTSSTNEENANANKTIQDNMESHEDDDVEMLDETEREKNVENENALVPLQKNFMEEDTVIIATEDNVKDVQSSPQEPTIGVEIENTGNTEKSVETIDSELILDSKQIEADNVSIPDPERIEPDNESIPAPEHIKPDNKSILDAEHIEPDHVLIPDPEHLRIENESKKADTESVPDPQHIEPDSESILNPEHIEPDSVNVFIPDPENEGIGNESKKTDTTNKTDSLDLATELDITDASNLPSTATEAKKIDTTNETGIISLATEFNVPNASNSDTEALVDNLQYNADPTESKTHECEILDVIKKNAVLSTDILDAEKEHEESSEDSEKIGTETTDDEKYNQKIADIDNKIVELAPDVDILLHAEVEQNVEEFSPDPNVLLNSNENDTKNNTEELACDINMLPETRDTHFEAEAVGLVTENIQMKTDETSTVSEEDDVVYIGNIKECSYNENNKLPQQSVTESVMDVDSVNVDHRKDSFKSTGGIGDNPVEFVEHLQEVSDITEDIKECFSNENNKLPQQSATESVMDVDSVNVGHLKDSFKFTGGIGDNPVEFAEHLQEVSDITEDVNNQGSEKIVMLPEIEQNKPQEEMLENVETCFKTSEVDSVEHAGTVTNSNSQIEDVGEPALKFMELDSNAVLEYTEKIPEADADDIEMVTDSRSECEELVEISSQTITSSPECEVIEIEPPEPEAELEASLLDKFNETEMSSTQCDDTECDKAVEEKVLEAEAVSPEIISQNEDFSLDVHSKEVVENELDIDTVPLIDKTEDSNERSTPTTIEPMLLLEDIVAEDNSESQFEEGSPLCKEPQEEHSIFLAATETDTAELQTDRILQKGDEAVQTKPIQNPNENETLNQEIIFNEGFESLQERVLNSDMLTDAENILVERANNAPPIIVNDTIDDCIEENLENIQNQYFSYETKRARMIHKRALDVDLPDIFEELGQNNAINDNTTYESSMEVAHTFDNTITAIAPSEDNSKLLEEFMESMQANPL